MIWWIDDLMNWWIDDLMNWWIAKLMNLPQPPSHPPSLPPPLLPPYLPLYLPLYLPPYLLLSLPPSTPSLPPSLPPFLQRLDTLLGFTNNQVHSLWNARQYICTTQPRKFSPVRWTPSHLTVVNAPEKISNYLKKRLVVNQNSTGLDTRETKP